LQPAQCHAKQLLSDTPKNMPWIRNKPVRIVMRWQLIVTVAMVLTLGLLWGFHGAASALLGGVVSIISAAAFSAIISRDQGATAGGVLITALKAEAVKIIVMVILLWLVLTLYKDVVAVGLIGTFALTVLIFGMALFVTDEPKAERIK
jgi:ATP synthase protein I